MNKYCEKTTLNNKVALQNEACIKLINCIIKKDSFHTDKKGTKEKCSDYKKICFGDAKAIDPDCVTGNSKKSCDMVIGLDNNKILLIELKLNGSKVPKNLDIEDMKNKLNFSKNLFQNNLSENALLIYCDRQKQRYYLTTRNSKTKKQKIEDLGFQFMTLQTFKTKYF